MFADDVEFYNLLLLREFCIFSGRVLYNDKYLNSNVTYTVGTFFLTKTVTSVTKSNLPSRENAGCSKVNYS